VKPRTLLVLALVVGALSAFVYFYERKLPSTDERRELEGKVFRLMAEDLTGLTLEWQGKTVKLEREAAPAKPAEGAVPAAAEWRIVEPISGRADRSLIERLGGDLADLEISRRLEGADPEDLGLTPPRGKLTWKTADGEGSLELGGDVPASSSLVVRASGHQGPLVVSKTIVSDLDRAPGDWRAKDVLALSRDAVERVRLVPRAGGEVVLSRNGDSFSVERPFADAADRELVDPLLSDLTGLRAEKFLDAPLPTAAEAALTAGPGRIELSVKGRTQPLVVDVGGETGKDSARYLRADGQAIEARTKLADALARPPQEWRSKSWTGFESWRAERVRIDDAHGKLELVRSGGDWTRDGKKMPYTEVGDLLYAISSARAERVVAPPDAAKYPQTGPTLTVVLSDANGAEETLTLYPASPAEKLVPARASGRDVVLLLADKTADDVASKIASLRAAKPIEEPAPAATGEKPDDGSKPQEPAPASGAATKTPG
jgi:hypothetical protein